MTMTKAEKHRLEVAEDRVTDMQDTIADLRRERDNLRNMCVGLEKASKQEEKAREAAEHQVARLTGYIHALRGLDPYGMRENETGTAMTNNHGEIRVVAGPARGEWEKHL